MRVEVTSRQGRVFFLSFPLDLRMSLRWCCLIGEPLWYLMRPKDAQTGSSPFFVRQWCPRPALGSTPFGSVSCWLWLKYAHKRLVIMVPAFGKLWRRMAHANESSFVTGGEITNRQLRAVARRLPLSRKEDTRIPLSSEGCTFQQVGHASVAQAFNE